METPNLRKAGMEHILENWVEEYSDQVFRVCYLYLSDYALAEDALQDTWVKAWKALTRQSDFPEHEKTWLMRITINTCKDYARTAWFRHVDRRTAAEEFPEAHLSTVQPDHSLSMVVMGLPGKYKQVILLYYYLSLITPFGFPVAREGESFYRYQHDDLTGEYQIIINEVCKITIYT